MVNRFPFVVQNLSRWIASKALAQATETDEIETKADSSKAAIDIWAYAEPAGAEPDPLKRNILQWRRLITSVQNPLAIFPGQSVDVIGFVHRSSLSASSLGTSSLDTAHQFLLARHVIRCCLADTVPLGLTIYSDRADEFGNDTWLHIQGTFETVAVRDKPTLVVIPEMIEIIAKPQKVYINGVF
jgi:uncharacterized repeat protein (TIGR03943 family)